VNLVNSLCTATPVCDGVPLEMPPFITVDKFPYGTSNLTFSQDLNGDLNMLVMSISGFSCTFQDAHQAISP
jgi:hypothetical protein